MSTAAVVIPQFDGNAEGFKEKLPYIGGEGSFLAEVVDARAGSAKDTNIPYVCVDFKVVESDNPNHPVGTRCVDYIALTGFYWKKDLAFLFAGITGNAPTAISNQVVAALIDSKAAIVGRRVMIQAKQVPYTNKKGEAKVATRKFYTCQSKPL